MNINYLEQWISSLDAEYLAYFQRDLNLLDKKCILGLDEKETWFLRKTLGVFDQGVRLSYAAVGQSVLESGYFENTVSQYHVANLIRSILYKMTLHMDMLKEKRKLVEGNCDALIVGLNLSKKSRNVLNKAGIKTVGMLLLCSFEYFVSFTEPVWNELLSRVREYNFSFEDARINDLQPGMNIRRDLKEKNYQNIPLSFLFWKEDLVQRLKVRGVLSLQDLIQQDYFKLYLEHVFDEPFLDKEIYSSWKNILISLFDKIGFYSKKEIVENLIQLGEFDKIGVDQLFSFRASNLLKQERIYTLQDVVCSSKIDSFNYRDAFYILNTLRKYGIDYSSFEHKR